MENANLNEPLFEVSPKERKPRVVPRPWSVEEDEVLLEGIVKGLLDRYVFII